MFLESEVSLDEAVGNVVADSYSTDPGLNGIKGELTGKNQ
jgi:hypothetical protein